MTIEGAVSSNTPALVVRTQGLDRRLQAGPAYKIGRDPTSDIVVSDSRVSWQHAVLRLEQGCWLLEDSGSTNGTFVGAQRVRRVPITGACEVRLGHPDSGPAVSCSVARPAVADPPAAGPMGTAVAATPSPDQGAGWAAQTPPDQRVDRAAPSPPGQRADWAAPRLPDEHANWAAQSRTPADWAAHSPLPADGAAQSPAAPARPPAPAPAWEQAPASSLVRQPSAIMQLPTRMLRIGRASDNDVVVSDLSVSRYHAELRKSGRGYEIVDLSSHNGTFVNGQWITASVVTERDIISIGPATFRLVGDELQEFIDTGDISLSARDLTVRLSSGKVLLDHVSFPLGERCLLGVIGPSGAGKSTLLGALTGIRPATEGSVLYDNRDLYTYYAELRHRIGLVPQDNILHTQLSARRALGYAAELRFPRDTSKAERQRRIGEVLEELSLSKHAETRTDALSGGQQKRVNVALELLTKPSLLFLDEPTSGLDPGLDKSVMEQMADLAHDGRTIIVVTHSVANLNLCDRLLVLVPGGKIAYFGPPENGLQYFGKPGWAEVFQAFDAEPGRDWASEFRRSSAYVRYISSEDSAPALQAAHAQAAGPAPATRNRLAQLSTLCRRYMAVIASDRVFLAFMAAMPLILGVLIRVVPAPLGLTGTSNADAESVLLVLVISACFAGAANSVRELVKERPIYSRERAAGLSAGAYLVSKLVILGLISGLQAAVVVFIGLVGRPLPPTGSLLTHLPLVEFLLAIGVLAITSMTLGLLISALVDTSEKTMPLLIVAVIFQVIMTGGIFALNGKAGLDQLSWLAPSRWGFAATASTSNLNVISLPPGISAKTASSGRAPAPGKAPASGKANVAGATLAAQSAYGHGATGTSGKKHRTAKTHAAGQTSAAGLTAPATGVTTPTPDPLWKHNPRTWLMDIGAMLLIGIVLTLITWRRLAGLSPGRRR
jgi:ABC-type multidrug transport system ATPase subunit